MATLRFRRDEAWGTAYSKAIDVPTYPSPVAIIASLNGTTVQPEVNITANSSTSSRPEHPAHRVQLPASNPPSATAASAPKPTPIDAELAGRLENAQGRLSAEQSYWEGVKQHMPAGTSLRPEITSQLFAANSIAQRCTKARDASDAASLASCIDVLNDHLTQLSIQH